MKLQLLIKNPKWLRNFMSKVHELAKKINMEIPSFNMHLIISKYLLPEGANIIVTVFKLITENSKEYE